MRHDARWKVYFMRHVFNGTMAQLWSANLAWIFFSIFVLNNFISLIQTALHQKSWYFDSFYTKISVNYDHYSNRFFLNAIIRNFWFLKFRTFHPKIHELFHILTCQYWKASQILKMHQVLESCKKKRIFMAHSQEKEFCIIFSFLTCIRL